MNAQSGRVQRAAARLRRLQWNVGLIGAAAFVILPDFEGTGWIRVVIFFAVILPIWTFPAIETGVRKFREGYNSPGPPLGHRRRKQTKNP